MWIVTNPRLSGPPEFQNMLDSPRKYISILSCLAWLGLVCDVSLCVTMLQRNDEYCKMVRIVRKNDNLVIVLVY